MSRIYGPIRQNGYVVRDIQAAMRWWTQVIGAGPFFYLERLTVERHTYMGRESAAPEISFAVGQGGDLQVELLQQHDDAPSIYRDFLDSGQEGLHHIAFWTQQFDDDLRRLLDQGLQVGEAGQSITGGPNARFAYLLDERQPGTVIELSDISGPKGALYRRVAEAARGWDGRDPIRELDLGSLHS